MRLFILCICIFDMEMGMSWACSTLQTILDLRTCGKEPSAACSSGDWGAQFNVLLKVCILVILLAAGCKQNWSKHHVPCPQA